MDPFRIWRKMKATKKKNEKRDRPKKILSSLPETGLVINHYDPQAIRTCARLRVIAWYSRMTSGRKTRVASTEFR